MRCHGDLFGCLPGIGASLEVHFNHALPLIARHEHFLLRPGVLLPGGTEPHVLLHYQVKVEFVHDHESRHDRHDDRVVVRECSLRDADAELQLVDAFLVRVPQICLSNDSDRHYINILRDEESMLIIWLVHFQFNSGFGLAE